MLGLASVSRRVCLQLMVLAAVCGGVRAEQAPPIRKMVTATDVLGDVIADLQAADPTARLSYRYLWLPSPREASIGALSFVINSAVSRSANMYRFVTLNGNQLVRLDLREICPKAEDYVELTHIWDRLAGIDPYFHIGQESLVQVDEFTHTDGKQYSAVRERRGFFSPHLGEAGNMILELTGRSGGFSAGTILRADWFMTKASTTLQEGQYYQFIGAINRFGKRLNQKEYLTKRGASEQLVESLNSDQRVAIVESRVTGKPRRVDLFRGTGVQISKGTGLISITHDGDDEDKGAATDPLRNLLEFKDKAREVILERPNGLLEFTLFDGQGQLQDVAPPTVVKDHTIPAPHTANLQPMMSCVRCHGPDEGWKPLVNDISKLQAVGVKLAGDLQSKLTVAETIERLNALYAGVPELQLIAARTSYSTAIGSITAGASTTDICRALSDTYFDYWLTRVTPQTALSELGLLVDSDAQAATVFRLLIPPLPQAEGVIQSEDNWIAFLAAEVPIPRNKWEEVFIDVSLRAAQRLQAIKQNLKEE